MKPHSPLCVNFQTIILSSNAKKRDFDMKAVLYYTIASLAISRRPFALAAILLSAAPLMLRGDTVLYTHGEPTNFEQYQLELINAARANPKAQADKLSIDLNQGLTLGRISTDAKQPLAFHRLLLQTARGHSDWMLKEDIFSHTGLNGSTPTERANAKRYKFSVAENIAYNSTSGTPNYSAYTLTTHNNLFKSSGHRTNLMDPSFTVVGLGLREGKFLDLNALMVTQNFSSGGVSVDSGPFLIGVVYKDLNGDSAYDPGEGIPGVRVEPNFGGYHAITSMSGGYAVPIPPLETVTQDYSIPLAVNSNTWETARPYDEAFRKLKVESAPEMTVQITWSGQNIGQAKQSCVTIRRPVRINYRLMGTDPYFYKKTMVSSLNVKADFNLANPPPRITTQPKSLIAVAGSSARFSVKASGKNLKYQWSKNGKPIKGATGAVFKISSAKPSNTGNYTVIVSNSGGKTMSKAAKLTVR